MQKKNKSFSHSSSSKSENYSSQNSLSPGQVWVYGRHPVLAALLNPKRKIHQILITKNNEADLKTFFSDKKINLNSSLIKIVDNDYLSSLFPQGQAQNATHQGFVIKTSEPVTISYNQFLNKIENLNKESFPPLLILDNLSDPQNIGAIIRSAVAFGFKNVVIGERHFPIHSPVIAKSSSGMIEMIDFIMVPNLNNFLSDLKKIGYWSVGLAGEAKNNIDKAREFKPIALVVGSEGEGIRKLVKENCDLLVKIPMHNDVESLNASVASAVAMYEVTR